MGTIRWEDLDKTLEIMQERGVEHVEFNPDGTLKVVVFQRISQGPYGLGWLPGEPERTPKQEAKVFAMPGGKEPEQKKESDIELALNPPNDVRFPVDDGKE